jgi:1,4-dihydroxy-2-naphthoate octaprenyltransferase
VSRAPTTALLLATRPKTLTAALAPVLVGTAIAAQQGYRVIWWVSTLALLSATAIQIGTNLFNDLLDFERGADTEHRMGPTRVTQSGALTPRQVRNAAVGSFVVAAALGVPLIAVGGWPILIVGVLSLLFGYAYTGGPFPLAYHGLGEVFVLVFFGLVAVGGVYYLQAGRVDGVAAIGGLQVGGLACGLLAVNNLRDVAADTAADKRTLAVRFGIGFGRLEILAFCLVPFAVGVLWAQVGSIPALLAPLATLPLAGVAVRAVFMHPPSERYNVVLAQVGALLLLFAILLAAGLVL